MSNTEIKTQFQVSEAFEIPHNEKFIEKHHSDEFWKIHGYRFQKECGCYVFGIGKKPYYVGKTAHTFKEAFTIDKLHKYNSALHSIKKGQPFMFFITYPTKKGKPNELHITELEALLIAKAYNKNPKLLKNIHGTKQEEWSIKNVLNSGQGKPSHTEKAFKKMMGLTKLLIISLGILLLDNTGYCQKIKSIEVETHSAKGNFGDYTPGKIITYIPNYMDAEGDGIKLDNCLVTFDTAGNIIERDDYINGDKNSITYIKYKYSAGKVIQQTSGSKNSGNTISVLTYNEYGKVIESNEYSMKHYKLDGNGDFVDTINILLERQKIKYNDNIITTDLYNGAGEFISETIRKQNTERKDTAIYFYNSNKDLYKYQIFNYHIDKNKNLWVYELKSGYNGPVEKTEYNPNGDIIAEGIDTTYSSWVTYHYNEHKYLSEQITNFNRDTTAYLYKYNEYGKWIEKEAVYKKKNLPLYFIERNITYFTKDGQ